MVSDLCQICSQICSNSVTQNSVGNNILECTSCGKGQYYFKNFFHLSLYDIKYYIPYYIKYNV